MAVRGDGVPASLSSVPGSCVSSSLGLHDSPVKWVWPCTRVAGEDAGRRAVKVNCPLGSGRVCESAPCAQSASVWPPQSQMSPHLVSYLRRDRRLLRYLRSRIVLMKHSLLVADYHSCQILERVALKVFI